MIPEHATIFKDMNLGRRPLSRLSYQIMGLNLIAVIILILGIFYLNSYRESLTATETELLATETELYSSILANTWQSNKSFSNQKNILKSFSGQKSHLAQMRLKIHLDLFQKLYLFYQIFVQSILICLFILIQMPNSLVR